MKKQLQISIILILFLGCSRKGNDYYPLSEGLVWHYTVSTSGNNFSLGPTSFSLTVSNLSQRIIGNTKVFTQKTEVQNNSSFYFIVEDDSSVYYKGEQQSDDVEPKIYPSRNYLLKFPLKVGNNWTSVSKTLLTKSTVLLTEVIEKTDEVITVPAGTFKDCIRIKSTGKASAKEPWFGGRTAINVEIYSWYAPNVGLVKVIISERSNYMTIGSVKMAMQLESFKK